MRKYLHHPQFELVEVPVGPPHTKPKALNFALPLARGQHVVVYDAEDIPERGQLRLAASTFARYPRIACLQAELCIENSQESWLSSLFAAEYSGLFGLMLPNLATWGLPMPLGGTSNHFQLEVLRAVGGWDAFNVTEDADLGVRLARCGLITKVLPSRTFEEAPVTLGAWLAQRTRWMKGWMQTYLVHNRRPGVLLAEIGWRQFVGFQIYVGGLIICPLLHTLFAGSVIWQTIVAGGVDFSRTGFWVWFEYFIMVTGYLAAISVSLAGAYRYPNSARPWIQWALPLYWALIGVACVRALFQLLHRPHFWAKTSHGKTKLQRFSGSSISQTEAVPSEAAGPSIEERWNG